MDGVSDGFCVENGNVGVNHMSRGHTCASPWSPMHVLSLAWDLQDSEALGFGTSWFPGLRLSLVLKHRGVRLLFGGSLLLDFSPDLWTRSRQRGLE